MRRLVIVVALLTLTACGSDKTDPPKPPPAPKQLVPDGYGREYLSAEEVLVGEERYRCIIWSGSKYGGGVWCERR